MKNTQPIKLNREFRRIYSRGKSYAAGFVVVYAMKGKQGVRRCAFAVSKSFGKAVERNRIKRLMRESYRSMEARVNDGFDYIIVARNRAKDKTLVQITKDMEYAMRNLAVID